MPDEIAENLRISFFAEKDILAAPMGQRVLPPTLCRVSPPKKERKSRRLRLRTCVQAVLAIETAVERRCALTCVETTLPGRQKQM